MGPFLRISRGKSWFSSWFRGVVTGFFCFGEVRAEGPKRALLSGLDERPTLEIVPVPVSFPLEIVPVPVSFPGGLLFERLSGVQCRAILALPLFSSSRLNGEQMSKKLSERRLRFRRGIERHPKLVPKQSVETFAFSASG